MTTQKVTIPDFGNVQDIVVVEVYVSIGDTVKVEDPLIALESEKAVMDIPSTAAGTVKEIYLKEEAAVKSGDDILLLEIDEGEEESVDKEEKQEKQAPRQKAEQPEQVEAAADKESKDQETPGQYHATPSVRAYAREQDVALEDVRGTGPKGRIFREDVDKVKKTGIRKTELQVPPGSLPQHGPLEDFSTYGEVEKVTLTRIKKISGPQLLRSWVTIPHVTHFDESDVTELEAFRRELNDEAEDQIRYSALVFIVKAVVAALKAFPEVNSSLDADKNILVLKYFYNIGIAVDTPDGLVVPVIKGADKKGIKEIASDLRRLSEAARDGKLTIADMQGATFTISNLGGIGGTGFTPIINSPQVAILGLSRNYKKPVWNEQQQVFRPRLTLPFSLSYDHRVIDGAEAARFCKALSRSIEDLRRALL